LTFLSLAFTCFRIMSEITKIQESEKTILNSAKAKVQNYESE